MAWRVACGVVWWCDVVMLWCCDVVTLWCCDVVMALLWCVFLLSGPALVWAFVLKLEPGNQIGHDVNASTRLSGTNIVFFRMKDAEETLPGVNLRRQHRRKVNVVGRSMVESARWRQRALDSDCWDPSGMHWTGSGWWFGHAAIFACGKHLWQEFQEASNILYWSDIMIWVWILGC